MAGHKKSGPPLLILLNDTPIGQITMKRDDLTYFGAGPAALPTDVLATAAEALQNYEGTGL